MAAHSYGTTFTFSGITAQVTTITVGGISVNAVETTHLASANAAKEFIGGLIDAGELTLTLNMVKSNYSSLAATLRSTAAFSLVLAGALGTLSGTGLITSLGIAVPEDDRITNDVTIKITGLPTFA